uniref:non-specific serine/threonine protein kinase n=1 Tax=Fagus sylvatica TaxID=28930 RepID=A0A2N9IER8_FAGSY
MATIFVFLLLSAIFTAEAQLGQSNIVKPGSLLTPTTNSTWLSSSGLYAFGFYKQGSGYAVGIFVAGIPQKTVVWTANRDNPPVPTNVILNFTIDGRLVLQSPQGIVTSIANSPGGATSASMLDSGNFVLYNSDNKTIWQSFEHPTDTLLPSQHLSAGEVLYSSVSDSDQSTGLFRLIMQLDGWLAWYPIGTPYTIDYGYMSYGVAGEGNDVTLNLVDDGHLYLANGTGTIIVNLNSGNSTKGVVLYLLRIDADGILRLYSHNIGQNGSWSITWFAPDDKCAPKGLCGLNGFCVLIDQDFGCNCLPGFAFVNQSTKSLGCERNFTAESCKEASVTYTMEAVTNTVWENDNFSVLLSSTQETCKEACLGDCNCEAALFKDGECKKQRLPLRFGRRLQSDSNVALIKVGISTPTLDRIGPKESKKEVRVDILIISVSLVAFAFIVLVISGIVMYRYRVWEYGMISNNGNIVLSEDVSLRSFTYAELEKVTDGFKEELGRGSFGTVYKGELREWSEDQTKTFTDIRGTRGYVAPKWHRKMPVTVKVDVYSFGMMLLEIICCRKNVHYDLSEEEAILEEWVYHCFECGELGKLVNEEEVDKKQLERIVKVALWCILDEPSLRPSMKKVLLMLEGTVDIPIPPSPTSFLSTI